MKFKLFAIVILLVALLMIVGSASADQPGKNEDPFGGLADLGIANDGVGVSGRFGLCPWGCPINGGFPSKLSGDGTSPRKAIYIAGIWSGLNWDPIELKNCSTVTIPAGNARWFKLETWSDRRVDIWVDDEANGAKGPSGSAQFGAADRYMEGTDPSSIWNANALDTSQSPNFLEGFVMAVYDPDNLKPNYAFMPPNAGILTFDADEKGFIKRGPDNVSLKEVTGAGIHGYGSYNPNRANHLLFYEGRFNGWVFVRVSNQMIWDGAATVCSQRIRD
jgi:hypothetical protein